MISICTSILNQSDYLKRMVESVRSQTYKDWELIVVDDGSTENIKGLLEGFFDDRIKYIRFDENKGIPHGLNHAFSLAQGDYIQPLSADEWIWDRKLEIQVAFLEKNPGVGCVWGLPGKGPLGERPEYEQYQLRAHNRSREAWLRTLLRFENIPIGGASMLMRREVLEEIGYFDPQFFHCSDLELFVRFFQENDGRVLPYRFADADQPAERLTAPSEANAKRFKEDVDKLHEKWPLVPKPPIGEVTVFVPVYNMAQFIGKALQSIATQTVDCKVIVLDDGSTDNLNEVLQDWKGDLKLIRFPENMGVRHALNAGIAQCDTEFFCSLAADDWLEPTFLEKALQEFTKDPWLEFVASQTDFYDKDCKPLKAGVSDVQRIEKAANKPREQWLNRLYYGNVYFGCGVYRTEALAQIGGFDTEAGVLCDYDVYLKLLQRENIKIVEEDLTHTRIHEGNASIGKFTPQWLRQKYHDIKKRYYPQRMKCIIATPFYEMRGFSPYIWSLFHTAQLLQANGIQAEFWELSGDSYVDRAKNTLFNKFLEDPDATDLFLIDSDMQWNPDSILKMLLLPEPILIGSYPQKNAWGKWTSTPILEQDKDNPSISRPLGRMLPDGSALLKSQYLAGGFMRMKREPLQKFKDAYTEDTYHDVSADPSSPDRLYTNFFQCEVKDGLRWGEDRVFGKKLDKLGIEVFIYPNIDFGHYGIKGWTGNFDRFLRNPDGVRENMNGLEKVA